MTNFWNTSDGGTIEQTAEFESGGGAFDLFPEGTKLLAMIDEAKWKAGYDGAPDVISLRWSVVAPEQFKNRKVFHNVKVNDEKPTTADNAKRMLAAIDLNAGGKLMKLGREPEDNELMSALMNKPMVISMAIWEMDGKTGNWVRAVAPRKAGDKPVATPAPVVAPAPSMDGFDDDVPF